MERRLPIHPVVRSLAMTKVRPAALDLDEWCWRRRRDTWHMRPATRDFGGAGRAMQIRTADTKNVLGDVELAVTDARQTRQGVAHVSSSARHPRAPETSGTTTMTISAVWGRKSGFSECLGFPAALRPPIFNENVQGTISPTRNAVFKMFPAFPASWS